MKTTVDLKIRPVLAYSLVLSMSGCIHYDRTAFYTGGPDHPYDTVRHSETWHIVDAPSTSGHKYIEDGDIIRIEHSGNRKRPVMHWQGKYFQTDIEMQEIKQRGAVGELDYDFESIAPVKIGDHFHRIKIGKNDKDLTGVKGEIVFTFEDTTDTGDDHGGHAGGGR